MSTKRDSYLSDISLLKQLSEELKQEIFQKTILNNRYLLHKPTAKQTEFLLYQGLEAFYGGSAGGGKSDALLMAALQFVEQPGYNAILFRRTYQDLTLPEALMDRAFSWLTGTDAKWNGLAHSWSFPSSAKLCFGYLDTEQDKYRYQSSAYQFIGFDEVTQFTLSQYRYLFSRLRQLQKSPIPLRMRSASNPGGIGHDWVKQRFVVEGAHLMRPFVPARLRDNPYLNAESYVQSLAQLDPITRKQYLDGDWTVRQGGSKFKREWFDLVEFPAPKDVPRVRYWDLAATTAKPGADPDYTVGAKVALDKGTYYLEDIQRFRERPAIVETRIKQTAQIDYDLHEHNCQVWMEQEPGSSGVGMIDHYARDVLLGFNFRGHKVSGDKEVRANPVSSAAEQRNFKLVRSTWTREDGELRPARGTWIGAFLDEAEAFPLGAHDDQVDAVSGAFEALRVSGPITAITGEVPR